jgi:SAM-dependent methyltransferase
VERDVSAAPDGSPVELYALLPERGEGELVARAVPAGGSILELGCGAGRITRQLVRLGYRVTAVDESPEMLAFVEDAERVCARIEGLDLGRRFDAALLASNLLTAPEEQRRAFLATCRRHAELVVVETLPLGWEPREGEARLGEIVSRLEVERVEDGVVHDCCRCGCSRSTAVRRPRCCGSSPPSRTPPVQETEETATMAEWAICSRMPSGSDASSC